MIKINKPAKVPRMLTAQGKGVGQTQLDCDEFISNKDDFLSGAAKMSEKLNKIYGSQGVKMALLKAQHNKCCYCERRRERIEIDVEHFRPKGAVQQSRGETEFFPGYYWLAYNWDNLYLACKSCNTGNKGILFPLVDKSKRTRWHGDANRIEDEEPLLINPGFENPSDYLLYIRDTPTPKNMKGKITIRDLGLTAEKRPLLKEARLELIVDLEYYCTAIKAAVKRPDVDELIELSNIAKQKLRAAVSPSSEFSLMALNFIEDYFAKIGILVDFLN